MSPRTIQHIDWQGIRVEIAFNPDWMGGLAALLEVTAVAPERSPLPITETGYRSHFCDFGSVEAAGGPVAYTQSWLDHAAAKPVWLQYIASQRQLTLF